MSQATTPIVSAPGAISLRWLLTVYLVVPLSAVAVLLDLTVLGGQLREALPRDPDKTLWYLLLFGLPHIVASEMTFLRRDYVARYHRLLVIALPASLGLGLIMTYGLSQQMAYVIFACLTMIHVIGQQIGLSRGMLQGSSLFFGLWKWSLIGSACSVMIALGLLAPSDNAWTTHTLIALGLIVISNLFFFMVVRDARHRTGYWYCCATHAMVIVAVLCFVLDYSFFAIMLPRLVHDVTAFVFYTTHERARVRQAPTSGRLRAYLASGITMYWALPLAAIALALSFNLLLPTLFVLTLTLLHYALENRIWRFGSPHREAIRFV